MDGDKPSRPRVDPKNDRRAARTKAPAKPSKPRANKKARREAATNQGFLMITTSPTGIPVVIDGKPTGLKTPVRRPHPLAPGTHVVRLVGRSGRPTDYSVKITPGSTTKLVKRVP